AVVRGAGRRGAAGDRPGRGRERPPPRGAGRLRIRHHRPARLRLRLPPAVAHGRAAARRDPRPRRPRRGRRPRPARPGPRLVPARSHPARSGPRAVPARSHPARPHQPSGKEHLAMTTTLSVIGVGYLGAVHAAAMAELGHDVIGLDIDAERVAALQAGVPPFHEPGFEQILARGLASGRLRFTTDYAELAHAEVHFLGLGTPQREDGFGADLSHLESAVDALAEVLPARGGAPTLVAGKSTVPAGTARRLADRLAHLDGVHLLWNPEFLREGFAVQDT